MGTLYQLHFILEGKEYAYRGSQSLVPRIGDLVVLGQSILYEVEGLQWRYDSEPDGPRFVPVDLFIRKVGK